MRIEALTARCFRNLTAVQLAVTSPIVVLKGQNGQGKTNILEAMYLCATGRSFRQALAREMVQHGASGGHVSCELQRQGVRHQVDVKIGLQGRTLRVDDRALRHQAMLLELVNMVAFFPDDLHIAKGGPEGRRRFLDRAVAGSRPDFVRATLDYHRALKARNALLRAPQAPDRALLSVYDEQLVRFGEVMNSARQEVLAGLRPLAQTHFMSMMPDVGGLSLGLHTGVPMARGGPDFGTPPGSVTASSDAVRSAGTTSASSLTHASDSADAFRLTHASGSPSSPGLRYASDSADASGLAHASGSANAAAITRNPHASYSPEVSGEFPSAATSNFAAAFAQALKQGYPRDRARGMTLVGPHRADLLCAMDGRDVRQFASQGQQRAMVLSLKLAEVVHLKQKLGAPPILLLDDVSSELDAERTRRLFEVVRQVESQVFVSTTGHVPLPIVGAPQVLRVTGGEIALEAAL